MNVPVTLAEPVEELPLDVFELADDGVEVESLTGVGNFAPGRTCPCSTCNYTGSCLCFC